MLCYDIVGGARARLVSTVSELRGRGGGSPQGTASLASQRKIPLAGQASHTLSFFCHNGNSCSLSLDLTDPDRLECLPVVGQGEEIVLFAVC